MKIVYLSRNMKSYRSASYQQDVMDELARQARVFFYGPGFEDYDTSDSIDQVLTKAPFEPDAIVLGHAWLNDRDGTEVDPHPRLHLSKTDKPKAVILNKEYTNLDAKMDYIKQNRFDLGFTHHHDTVRYTNASGTEFTFWPFAYDPRRFNYSKGEKTIDVAFSGVLQNQRGNSVQSDIRVRIMQCLFHTWMEVPLMKKKIHAETNIFWNSISRKKSGRYLCALLGKRKYLNDAQYTGLMWNSKVCINTLSPMGLISPRFFESMASKVLVFCEESELYKNIFPHDIFVTFNKDLRDFDEKLSYYLKNDSMRDKIVNRAFEYVHANHTWKIRVNSLLCTISNPTIDLFPTQLTY